MVLAGIVGGAIAQRSHPPLNAQSTNSTVDSRFIDANLQFGFKLFSEIVRQSDRNENIFVSPTSVASYNSNSPQKTGRNG
jgi:serine protease inhibitor